jgi:hypothetical protein
MTHEHDRKQQCTSPVKIVHGTEGAKLVVGLVGDALVEPFWPQGTGANRAFLSCFDLTWAIKGFFERCRSDADEAKLTAEWIADYKTMVRLYPPFTLPRLGCGGFVDQTFVLLQSTASPADLNPNMGAFTIDPRTRYKKTSLGRFH